MKKLFVFLAAVLLLLITISTPGAALAASIQQSQARTHQVHTMPLLPTVTCSKEGCTGLDPIKTGCSADATTLLSKGIFNSSGQQIGLVELRWSPTCQTNWARTTSSIGSVEMSARVDRDGGPDGPGIAPCIPDNCDPHLYSGTLAYTDMVWARDVAARAIGQIIQGSVFTGCVTQDQTGLPC